MTRFARRPGWGTMLAVMGVALVTGNFVLAAVQGEHGLTRRWQIEGDIALLEAHKAALQGELAELSNLTRRLSDQSLDLDLLDERARVVLGHLRADEVVIH